MTQLGRLIGGAGTGKTTELLSIMTGARDKLGGDVMALGFASFTRAAREEAAERASLAWGVPSTALTKDGWFRTVHSIVYRLLGVTSEQLVRTDSKADVEWLANVMGVSVHAEIDEDTGKATFRGDPVVASSLNCWELARATLRPIEDVVRLARIVDDNVPDIGAIVRVCDKYESAKRIDGRADFSDMLLRFAGLRVLPKYGISQCEPEGEPPAVQAWLFDEQQDASPLLDAVCKRLVSAPSVKWAYVVGDPFQAIYGFAGSNADCFLGWPAHKERIMPKSYRCPRPILELGEQCLRRMHRGYFDRGIAPADHEGVIDERGSIDEACDEVRGDQSWLLIARTNFQAQRYMGALAERGIPFRSTKSPPGLTARTQAFKALWSLERGDGVSGEDWGRVLEALPSRRRDGAVMLKRGTKSAFAKPEVSERWDAIFPRDLDELGCSPELRDMIACGRWAELCDYGEHFVRAAKRWGVDIAANPGVRVGTIHSVKGAEADNVALLTTTGVRVAAGMESTEQHDEECRVTYVGVTRARRRLVVVNEGRWNTHRMEVL